MPVLACIVMSTGWQPTIVQPFPQSLDFGPKLRDACFVHPASTSALKVSISFAHTTERIRLARHPLAPFLAQERVNASVVLSKPIGTIVVQAYFRFTQSFPKPLNLS